MGIQICPPSCDGFGAASNYLQAVSRKCDQAETAVVIESVLPSFVVLAGPVISSG